MTAFCLQSHHSDSERAFKLVSMILTSTQTGVINSLQCLLKRIYELFNRIIVISLLNVTVTLFQLQFAVFFGGLVDHFKLTTVPLCLSTGSTSHSLLLPPSTVMEKSPYGIDSSVGPQYV